MGIAYVVVRHSFSFKPLRPTSIHGSLSHPRAVVNRMVLFFIALLLSCFTHSSASTCISVAVMSVMVACLTVWSILTTWRSDDDWEELDKRWAVLKRINRILARVKHFTLSTFTPGWQRAYPTPYGPMTEHQDRSV